MIDAAIDEILGPHGVLSRALEGYEHRPQQLVMAQAVARALADSRPLLVEAGTGTGKTLAYLVPAILSGKKVIVSTGTKALQEQIHGKDVPLLARHLGEDVSAAVLKGISNYLCLRRFAEAGDPGDADFAAIAAWAEKTATGDRADAERVPDESPAWRLVTTTPDARLGPKCPFFERCWVTQARRAAAKAQIVIVNHHLFFADLALRATYPGAQVLPEYDAVIFDEAHQIEEIATEHFGCAVSTHRLAALARDAEKALGASTMLTNLEGRGEAFFAAARARLPASDASRVSTPRDLFADGHARDTWFRLDAALEDVAAAAREKCREPIDRAEGAQARRAALPRGDASFVDHEDAAAVVRRAEGLRADLAVIAEPSAAHRHVHWGEVRGRAVHLHASPVDVAPLLREHLLSATGALVFTSATLTADGSFAYVRDRLGLPDEDADEVAVESPFHYPEQAMLYLPRDLPLPDEPGFPAAALARTVELLALTKGRAFVLFTSKRSLRHAATTLRAATLPYPLLVQGEAPRATLLAQFRERVGSVLLATSSFWEGIDVPGEALSLVILEKLPFAAPDDPLTAARVARLEERGEDPFSRYQVPRAALALKQGFGRLIRRRDDRGIVAILDGRIVSRGYGRAFLTTLPPASRTSNLEQVRRWWERAVVA